MITPNPLLAPRLVSLDVLRGIVMILLAGEAAGVYEALAHSPLPPYAHALTNQFFHHPWHGLRFWDLVQPAFMTIAGTAMFLSWQLRKKQGTSWAANGRHMLKRCFRLFLAGVALHCVYRGKLVWELWNVLTQLSVTLLIAYLVVRGSWKFQLVISFGLLLLTEVLYRYIQVPGFDQLFVHSRNFGAYMDTVLMGKINSDGWVAINFLPTAAHTIWGSLAGKLLSGDRFSRHKVRILAAAGLAALAAGYGLDQAGITPIIKRIATSSFVIVSGGWVMLMVALSYWIIDVYRKNRLAWIAVVVGMNPIFIYLFFETVMPQWGNKTVGIFVNGGLAAAGFPEWAQHLATALVAWFLIWSLSNWLYRKKIFFKL